MHIGGISGSLLSNVTNLEIHSATYEDNTYYWTVINSTTLIIIGSGSIGLPSGEAPWSEYADTISRVMVQDGVTSIGDRMFSGLANLKIFSLPETVTSIGEYAFSGCGINANGMDRIYIPSRLTTIPQTAFLGCTNLKHVYVSNNNAAFKNQSISEVGKITVSDTSAMYNSDKSVLKLVPAGVTESHSILSSVRTVDTYAFAYSSINQIAFNDVTTINQNAFYRSSVTFADLNSVTVLNDNAFKDASGLRSVSFNATGSLTVGSDVFDNTGLMTLRIADTVTSVSWQDDSLPESDWYKDFVIPISDEGVIDYDMVEPGHYYSTSNILPLTSWDISSAQDESLYLVILDDLAIVVTMKERDSYSMINFVNSGARGYDTLKSTPSSLSIYCKTLRNIGDNAFNGFNGLTSIIIPDSVTAIGQNAFYEATGLSTLVLPDRLITVGANAFGNNHLSGSITFPDGVTSIGTSAFNRETGYNSTSLSSVIIGSSVSSIGANAFAKHAEIGMVMIRGAGTVTIDANAFTDSSGVDLEFKLDGSGSAQALSGSVESGFWVKDSAGYITVGSNARAFNIDGIVVIMGSGAMYSYSDLSESDKTAWDGMEASSITITGDITVSTDLFTRNSVKNYLTTLTLDDVSTVGDDAFSGCTRLTKLTLPASAFAPTMGYDLSAFSFGSDALSGVDLVKLYVQCAAGTFIFMDTEDHQFEQSGRVISVPGVIWMDESGNWVSGFIDGESYSPTELSGYTTNDYTATVTTTM